MSFSCFGKVLEITQMEKGYKRYILTVNVPFKTKLLKFNVWKKNLPDFGDLTKLEVDDEVYVQYHYKNGYPQLDDVNMAVIDNCPVCCSYLEATDAQRMDCQGCNSMPESEHKERIDSCFELKSSNIESYKYSSGYKLKFENRESQKELTCVIFESNPLYSKMSNLKVSNVYHVIGWKDTAKSEFRFVDITGIY